MFTGRYIASALIVITICLAHAWGAGAAMAGEPAPAFSLPGMDGNRVDLAALTGKVVLITFWAPWCTGCRQEMPAYEALSRKYHAQGLFVIGIDVDSSRRLAENFVERFGITFPVVFDEDGRVSGEYGFAGLPASFLIDRNSVIAHRRPGFDSSMIPALEQEIETLLNETRRK